MENIYGVSKGEKIIQIFNEEHVLNANFHQSINNAAILTFEVDEPIQQDVEFFLVRDPINDVNRDEFMYFQLTDTESDGYTWTYRAEEYAYHELSSIGYVKKIYTPDSVFNATELLEDILYNDVLPEMANRPQWRVDKTDIVLPDTFPGGNSTYTLWYNHPLRGIQKFIEYFGGEVRFFVTIVNNKIDSRWVQVLQQRGRKTGKRYESNSNLISLSNKSEYTNRYQYIVPLADGAGDNGDEEKGDTPNGFSNYMTLSGLEVGSSSDRWYKPADQLYVSLANDKNADDFPVPPEGLSETPTIAPVTFSDISDKQALFDAAIEWLWENTQVAYSYSASVFDIGESQIGDTIAIIDEKTGLSSYVRVHDIDYDLLDPQNTAVHFGSNWGSSNDETIGDIVNGVINKGEQTAGNVDSAVRSSNGKNTNYYGSIEPSDPIEGDLWYWNNNNKFGIKIYHNGEWEDVVDSNLKNKIDTDVGNAIQEANDFANHLSTQLKGNLESQIDDVVIKLDTKTDVDTVLGLFENNFAFGLINNSGTIISGINGNKDGLVISGNKIVVDGDTTFLGDNFMDATVIKDATIGTAKIADLAVTSAKISELDVDKLSGDVTNFVNSYWNDPYENALHIDATGVEISYSDTRTKFDRSGINIVGNGVSVGGIGWNGFRNMPDDYTGLIFQLDGNAEYMAWSARDTGVTSGDYPVKLSWFRGNKFPSGYNKGFWFDDDVNFNYDVGFANGNVNFYSGFTSNGSVYIYPYSITDDNIRIEFTSAIFGSEVTSSVGSKNAYIGFGENEIYFALHGFYYKLSVILNDLGYNV